MSTTTATNEIRELSLDEIDGVSGGFRISFAGITVQASAEHLGVAVSIEGKGISVHQGGITVSDGKNVVTMGWDGKPK
jgi:hypothetical protein